jgi:class 3 adenylate cyclase
MPIKTVFVFDICSSTSIIEDLHRTEQTARYDELIRSIRTFLQQNQKSFGYEIYKFVGDGFILLFSETQAMDSIMTFSIALTTKCFIFIKDFLATYVETTSLERTGLTTGIDKGEVFYTDLGDAGLCEYFGRPINVACRLQASLDKPEHANKVLISKKCYLEISSKALRIACAETKRKLRNVNSTMEVRCYEFPPLYFMTKELSILRGSAEDAVVRQLKQELNLGSEIENTYKVAFESTSAMSSIISIDDGSKGGR